MASQDSYSHFTDEYKLDLVNLAELGALFSANSCCARCQTPGLKLVAKRVVGLATRITIVCSTCRLNASCMNSNSKVILLDDQPENVQTINLALVAATRVAGIGEAATQTMCAYLGLGHPPADWQKHQNIVAGAFHIRAVQSMTEALQEARENAITATGSPDLLASFDGSWMKRGQTSKVGFTSCLNFFSNKVIAVDTRAKYCPACKNRGQCKYGNECRSNYTGSSGGMEPVGAVRIVTSIYNQHHLRIKGYLGDGDSRAFHKVEEAVAKLDKPWQVIKLECVNHFAKRLGSRFRRAVQANKNQSVAGGRGIGGRGRLTGKIIDKLQTYYSFLIRSLSSDVDLLSRRVMAMFEHTASSDRSHNHKDCDPLICKYLKDPSTYKHSEHTHVPRPVMIKLQADFLFLAGKDLLDKCSHGKTQNGNECFNSTVWHRLPKSGFANRSLVELTVHLAVCIYNEGHSAVLDVFNFLGHPIGASTVERCQAIDHSRVEKRKRKQAARLAGVVKRREFGDEDAEVDEELQYEAGGF